MNNSQDIIETFPDEIPWQKLEPDPVILDRSTLERWAECPHQAALVAAKKIEIANEDTETGNCCHDAIASEILNVVQTDDRAVRSYEFAERLVSAGKNCHRVDLQPRVARVLGSCAWTVARIVCERSASDIMRFDGGPGVHSGQLASDIRVAGNGGGAVRITCEVDLLLATPSKEELDLYDWKSGWKRWTATEVKDSFQFQVYAWLILRNYPEVQRVNVRVAMLAENEVTGSVAFERDYMRAIERRIETAVDIIELHGGHDPEDVPAWPTPTKCLLCDAARHCRLASDYNADVAADPVEAIKRLVALEAAAERVRCALTAKVRKDGKDLIAVVNDTQVAFGTGKPTAARAKPCSLYEVPQ